MPKKKLGFFSLKVGKDLLKQGHINNSISPVEVGRGSDAVSKFFLKKKLGVKRVVTRQGGLALFLLVKVLLVKVLH